MTITKVWIEDDCTSCGICEGICPQVFLVKDICTIIEGVNYADYSLQIKDASESCPVDVIRYNEE